MDELETQAVRRAFATVLSEYRKAKGLSQEELAFRAGLSMSMVSLLETDKRQPTISTIWSLAQALEVTLTDFSSAIEAKLLSAIK